MSLHVNADGTLTHNGKPFRGFGVNYVGCFWRLLENPDDAPIRAGFRALAAARIPFARFAACGYWPSDNGLWASDRSGYLRRLDRVFDAAERAGVGLIPSLFWHYPTLPDLVGEPVRALGDPKSKTHAQMREYTSILVRRYRKSPALWGWELGNEYNLPADLPNAAEHRPPIVADKGTPKRRSADDEVTHAMIRTVAREFGREVRRHDTERLLHAGHGFPRASAWHQERERSWTQDSAMQFVQTLIADSPDPIDTLGGHLYAEESPRFGKPFSAEALLAAAQTAAHTARKPLFVGEFGTPGGDTKPEFAQMLDALVSADVALAALWVFDFPPQNEWSVTADNARAYQLAAIAGALKKARP